MTSLPAVTGGTDHHSGAAARLPRAERAARRPRRFARLRTDAHTRRFVSPCKAACAAGQKGCRTPKPENGPPGAGREAAPVQHGVVSEGLDLQRHHQLQRPPAPPPARVRVRRAPRRGTSRNAAAARRDDDGFLRNGRRMRTDLRPACANRLRHGRPRRDAEGRKTEKAKPRRTGIPAAAAGGGGRGLSRCYGVPPATGPSCACGGGRRPMPSGSSTCPRGERRYQRERTIANRAFERRRFINRDCSGKDPKPSHKCAAVQPTVG